MTTAPAHLPHGLPPKPAGAVRVVVVNAYVGNRIPDAFARWLRATGFDVALVGEASPGIARACSRLGAYFAGPATSRGAREVAVVLAGATVRKGRRRPRFKSKQITPFVSRPYAPDRWVTRVRVGSIVLYSVHANALVQHDRGGWTDNRGAQVWRDIGLPWLARRLRRDARRGFAVIGGGDFNAADKHDAASPAGFLHGLGLDVRAQGYMNLFFSPELRAVGRHVLATPPGADAHEVLVVDLVHTSHPAAPVVG